MTSLLHYLTFSFGISSPSTKINSRTRLYNAAASPASCLRSAGGWFVGNEVYDRKQKNYPGYKCAIFSGIIRTRYQIGHRMSIFGLYKYVPWQTVWVTRVGGREQSHPAGTSLRKQLSFFAPGPSGKDDLLLAKHHSGRERRRTADFHKFSF